MKRKKIKPANNRTSPILLIIGGVVILVAVLIYVAINAPTTSVPQASSISQPFPNITRVTITETKQALDSNSAVIVDVRDSGSYGAGHVAGSINIPLDELEDRFGELAKDSWIITYCTWPAENSSARAAEILLSKGYTKVEALLGGFAAWSEAGYPIEP